MTIFRMTDAQHNRLKAHLHDGTGLEAVAVGLCGRGGTLNRPLFSICDIVEIPYDACRRFPNRVTWPTRELKLLLARARAEGLAVFKIHSHPEGATDFSLLDDRSDADLFSAIAVKAPGEHISAVMLPDGEIFARCLDGKRDARRVDRVSLVGDELIFWDAHTREYVRVCDFDERHRQAFGDHTTHLLSGMSVAVVGVSGTGSPIVEMLARLGVGRIVLVEFDIVETKNLNRIWGTCRKDAERRVNKARAIKAHVHSLGLGTEIVVVEDRIESPEAIALGPVNT